MWPAPISRQDLLLFALVGALCLYVYIQRLNYQRLSAEYKVLSTQVDVQNAKIEEYRAQVAAATKRAKTRVVEVVTKGEETREFYLTQDATAKDMQAWWDDRRPQ